MFFIFIRFVFQIGITATTVSCHQKPDDKNASWSGDFECNEDSVEQACFFMKNRF
jgi:hypothetical protein